MKKISLAIVLSLFILPALVLAHNVSNWSYQFNDQQLSNYFGYNTHSSDHYYKSNHYDHDRYYDSRQYDNWYNDNRYYSNNYQNRRKNRVVKILDTKTTNTEIRVRVANIKLNRNERYSLTCRDIDGPIYNSQTFVNYDDLKNYNRNYPRNLKLKNLEPNTNYKCSIAIEEEYKKHNWRLLTALNWFSVKTETKAKDCDLRNTKCRRENYANSPNTHNDDYELNDPKRIDTENIETIVAYKHIPKSTKGIHLVGPRYYQYLVLKDLLADKK